MAPSISATCYSLPNSSDSQLPDPGSALEESIHMINKVLDFDTSKTEGRTVPKPGIEEELDELRETYEGLGSFLVCCNDRRKTAPDSVDDVWQRGDNQIRYAANEAASLLLPPTAGLPRRHCTHPRQAQRSARGYRHRSGLPGTAISWIALIFIC